MYYIYILKSLKDLGYYVGMTSDISGRLEYHNKGRVRSTKGRRPLVLIYEESFLTRVEARAREKYLKSYAGAKEKLTLIENA